MLENSGEPRPIGARIRAANDGNLVPACVRPWSRKSIAKTRRPALKRTRACFPRLSLFKRPPRTGTTARFPCPLELAVEVISVWGSKRNLLLCAAESFEL
jgi:hypothetical protein